MISEMKYYEIKESIEDNDIPFFNIINKRLKNFDKSKIGKYFTGPPDILYFIRQPIKSNYFSNFKLKKSKSQTKYKKNIISNKAFGSFIYIYGIDTSNLFSLENYINKYKEMQEKFFKIKNNVKSISTTFHRIKNSEIIKAVFCSYDFFMEKDFRIIFNYPEGFDKFYFYDGIKNDYNIGEDELRTIFLSSVLRTWNFNIENSFIKNNNNNIIFLEEIKNIENFNALIDSIIFILIERLEYKYPNLEKKLSILFFWFIKYLMDTRRYSFILTYFSKISHIDTNLAKFALKPLYYINGYKDGLKFIATLLTCNTNYSLICEEIEFLTILNKYEDALKLGKYLTNTNPGFNDAWIKLAEVYIKLKQYEKCLKALNNLNYLKNFLSMDNINYSNPYIVQNDFNKIIIKEIPLLNNNNNNLNISSLIKYTDLISIIKYNIDIYYNTSNLILGENDDLIKDIINKITNSNFLKFNYEQKNMYYILLKIMKEINFTKFIELKKNLFNKIIINPFLEFVINALIEDIKLFSLGCFIKDNSINNKKNKISNDLSYILNKNNLSKFEYIFCIMFGFLCERLKYYKIALKYYLKVTNFCFSKFVYYRIIKILLKQKDYKNCILNLNKFLLYFPQKEFYFIEKTPLWIDKTILEILYEHKSNDILSWLKTNSNKEIINFIKRIINKYKEWVENGHELHLIK